MTLIREIQFIRNFVNRHVTIQQPGFYQPQFIISDIML